MADNKKDENKSHSAAAGVAGAIIGAGIGAVATKILTDKNTQKMIRDKAGEVKQGVRDAIKTGEREMKKKKSEMGAESKT